MTTEIATAAEPAAAPSAMSLFERYLPALADEQLLDAIDAHPILINRPIVVTPQGVRLCRPPERQCSICFRHSRGLFPRRMAGKSSMPPAIGSPDGDRS